MEILLSLIPVVILGAPLFLWFFLLFHAIKNNIPNKPLWIIVLVLFSFLGGIAYYFAVYKDTSKK